MTTNLSATLATQLTHHAWQSVTSLVAVSGGADSVALLRGLHALRAQATGRLIVVHVNHRLRGVEADRDEAFVARLADRLELPLIACQGDAEALRDQGDSLEAAARALRYRCFERVANQQGARYLFTAHTADDQAETILHRILRGTGVEGLSGIPRVRALSSLTTIVRPMLSVRRREVLAYLAEIGQDYCEDATNVEFTYTRNRLRHDLIPKLTSEYNPQVVDALVRLGALAGEAQGCLRAAAEALADRAVEVSADGVRVSTGALVAAPPYLVQQLFLRVWQTNGWPLQAMSYDKWQELAALALSTTPGVLNLPGDIRAQKQGETLWLSRPVPSFDK